MDYDLAGLGPAHFERLCQALAIKILGADIRVFGSGPDGGREASFDGLLKYPDLSASAAWNGYGVLQAKYRERPTGTRGDQTWLRNRVKAELDAWADPDRARRQAGRAPQYLIIATNVPLSSVPGRGGKDTVATLIAQYAEKIGLKDWRIWDADQIKSFLDVHQDIAGSFAALITPNAVLARLRAAVLAYGPGSQPIAIGEGLPECEAAFRYAFSAARGFIALGEPTGPAYKTDLGYVQHLRFDDGREHTICALNHRPAVVVSAPVWEALCAVGDPAQGGGVLGAGFPVAPADGSAYIGPDSTVVCLDGGAWGPATLLRTELGTWRWRPATRFDSLASRDRTIWTGVKGDLRVRVAARIPWNVAGTRISSSDRRRVEAALAMADVSRVMSALARDRGIAAPASDWQKTPDGDGRNDTYGVSYVADIMGPNAQPALTGRVLFQLPTVSWDGAPIAVVDLRIDFAALAPAAPENTVPSEMRLTVYDLTDVFIWAWKLATRTLPLAIAENPAALPPGGAPRLELYVINEVADNAGGPRILRTDQMVDSSAFGATARTYLYDMATAVTAPIDLADDEIEATVRSAMVRMGEDYGFTEADFAFSTVAASGGVVPIPAPGVAIRSHAVGRPIGRTGGAISASGR